MDIVRAIGSWAVHEHPGSWESWVTPSHYHNFQLPIFPRLLNFFKFFDFLLENLLLQESISQNYFLLLEGWEHSFEKVSRLKRKSSLTQNDRFCSEIYDLLFLCKDSIRSFFLYNLNLSESIYHNLSILKQINSCNCGVGVENLFSENLMNVME